MIKRQTTMKSRMSVFDRVLHRIPPKQQIIDLIIKSPEEQELIDQKLLHLYNQLTYHEQYDVIIEILKMNIQFRTDKQISYLLEFLKETYFIKIQDQDPDKLKYVMKQVQYENLIKGKTLFDYKDMGSKLYYILKGSVWVLIPIKYQYQQFDKLVSEFQIKRQSLVNNSILKYEQKDKEYQQILNRICIENIKDQFLDQLNLSSDNLMVVNILKKYSNFRLVGEIQEGYTFGEICFKESGFRNATIIAKNDSQFAVLNNQYLKNLDQQVKFQFEYIFEFLLKNNLFQGCLQQEIRILSYNAQEIKIFKNSHIYNQGENNDNFYIVKSGQVNLLEKIDNLAETAKEKVYSAFMTTNVTYKLGQSKINSQYQKKVVANLNEGQCFGEEIFLNQKYLTYAVAQSMEVILIKFSKKDVLNNLQNFNFITNVRKIYQQKLQYRSEYKQNYQRQISQKDKDLVKQLPQNLKQRVIFSNSIERQPSVQKLIDKQQSYENKIAQKNKFGSILEISQACQILQTQSKSKKDNKKQDLKDIKLQIQKSLKLFYIQNSKQRTLTNYMPIKQKTQSYVQIQKRVIRAKSSLN